MRIENLTHKTLVRVGAYENQIVRDGEGVTVHTDGRVQNLASYRYRKEREYFEIWLSEAELRRMLAAYEAQNPEALLANAVKGAANVIPEAWGVFTAIDWMDGRAVTAHERTGIVMPQVADPAKRVLDDYVQAEYEEKQS